MEEKIFINPIDPKKVAQNPGLLPYAHNAASAVVKPIDKGRAKGIAVRCTSSRILIWIRLENK
jgi:hypothetical protein